MYAELLANGSVLNYFSMHLEENKNIELLFSSYLYIELFL